MAHRFGVTTNIPAYLPIALGAVEITLEEQVASYSVFPNDGVRVKPRLIRKVSNADGITLWEDPSQVDEVISQQTARTMMTFLRAVTAHGTGAAASQLNHPVGGKTGTTSDYTDAWFLGFSPSVTCGVWVGYDSRESLGEKETGARAALPIWMAFMKQAIAGKDDEEFLGEPNEERNPVLKAQSEVPAKPPASLAPSSRSPGASAPKLGLGTTAPQTTAAPKPAAPIPQHPAQATPNQQTPKSALSSPLSQPAANPAKPPPPLPPVEVRKPSGHRSSEE